MYHFLSGYTARVAGTEKGVTEPKATFSTCFGAPFLPLNPNVYAKMLGEKIAKHQARGVAGEHRLDRRPVRRRQPHEDRAHARDDHARRSPASSTTSRYQNAPDLQPRRADQLCPACRTACSTRAAPGPTPAKYDEQAGKLAQMFADNFKTFEGDVRTAVKAGRPEGCR